MSINCTPDQPNPTPTERFAQKLDRDLGASPIFNINTEIIPCIERFESPSYILSGACEQVSGLTLTTVCPNGYTLTADSGSCVQITTTTGSTLNISGNPTTIAGDTDITYNQNGVVFLPNISGYVLPLQFSGGSGVHGMFSGSNFVVDQVGTVVDYLAGGPGITYNGLPQIKNSLWGDGLSSANGRMNNAGVKASPEPTNEFIGLTYCVEILSAGTYNVGFAGDNKTKMKLNGTSIFEQIAPFSGLETPYSGVTLDTQHWWVFETDLEAGKNIFEVQYLTTGITSNLAFEVYDTTYDVLSGYTTTNGLSGSTIYTTEDSIGAGEYWSSDSGNTFGYYCSSGYTLDVCTSGDPSCSLINYTDEVVGGYREPDCLYNLSEIDSFDLTFNLTGSTDYTGYTGQFCYQLHGVLTPTSTNLGKVCVPYSGITGATISQTIEKNVDIPILDNEFRVVSYNKFTSKCATNSLGFTGITIDESNYSPRSTYGDRYFVTVVNPPKAVLDFIPSDIFEDITFRNETVKNFSVGQVSFTLPQAPVGAVAVISVNGLTISVDDYNIVDRLVTFSQPLEPIDIVGIYYNTTLQTEAGFGGLVDRVKLEMFNVTGATSGFTSNFSATTYTNIINYNPTSNRYEAFLTEKMDPNIQPVITINGLNMVYDIDVYRSNIVQNKLVFNEGIVINPGDILSVYYYFTGFNLPGDLGELKTDSPTITWALQQGVVRGQFSYGNFTIEITDRDDINYDNILYTSELVNYANSKPNYTLNVGPLTSTTVDDYIYRVKFRKTYQTTHLINQYYTESYSNNGSFKLKWGYINNTKY